jgi:hypothetical protein
MPNILAFEVGVEPGKSLQGNRRWVFARPGPAHPAATTRAKP